MSRESSKLVGSESPSNQQNQYIKNHKDLKIILSVCRYMQVVKLDAKGIRETDSPGHGDDEFVLAT